GPLAGEAYYAAVVDAGGDPHLQPRRGGDDAAAAAARAGGTGFDARTAADGAGAAEGDVPLGGPHPARAAAGRAGPRLRIVAARARAARAGGRALHLQDAGRAAHRVREVDLEGGAQVGAGLRAGRGMAAGLPEDLAEDVPEDVAEVDVEALEAHASARRRLPAAAPLPPGFRLLRIPADLRGVHAHLVVEGALFRIGEDVEGEADLLELLLGLLVPRVDVGVVLAGEAAVGLLDLLGGGGARDSESCVQIVAFRHVRAKVTSRSGSSIAGSRPSSYHAKDHAPARAAPRSPPRPSRRGRAGPPRPGGGGLHHGDRRDAASDHPLGSGAGGAAGAGRAGGTGGGGGRAAGRAPGRRARLAAVGTPHPRRGGAARHRPGGRGGDPARGGGARAALRFRGGLRRLFATARHRAGGGLARGAAAARGRPLHRVAHPPR